MTKGKSRKRKPKRTSIGSSPPKKQRSGLVQLNVLPRQLWLRVSTGVTIWEALQETNVDLEGDCGGLGKCGKCKVKVVSAIGRPTKEERELLGKDELSQGIRLACRTRINRDIQIDVGEPDPELEHMQILKTGYRPMLQLDPLVDQKIVTSPPEVGREGVSDLDRIKLALGPGYQDLTATLGCLRSLPEVVKRSHFDGAVVLHDNQLMGWQDWGRLGRRYGIVFDIGTTTLVGKLVSLLDTKEIAAISCLNGQYKYGANVISRLQYVKDHPDGLDKLSRLLMADLNRITDGLLEVGRLEPDDIFIAVFAGNTTMQHLALGLPPLGIAEAPFTPVLTDGLITRAVDVGLNLHPEALVYVMPARSGYVGGDLIGVILASGAAEQDDQIVLGLDLGTNGEVFLGNRKRLLTCSAAAGPALEGARISSGMIAKTGAIESVRIDESGLRYKVIGNTKPKGLCGSGLVDIAAVLLHSDLIDLEGLVRPPRDRTGSGLESRLIPGEDVYRFLIATRDESYNGSEIYLTQKDVRELQLAKAAVAAGVRTLVDDLGISLRDIDRVVLAGALGNYVHPLSAMRIGLLPDVDPNIIESIGNGASTGASMVLLSRRYWEMANDLSDRIEHVELSSRVDFNEYFIEQIDFPEENSW